MPLLRTARVLLGYRFRPKLGPLAESVLSMIVWPNDLDVNRHMNNGRFLTLMDLGRFDLMGRTGLLARARRRRWFALVGSSTIRFRRSLAPFQRYRLRTRIAGWDEKWFFVEQRFERGSEEVALGCIKGLLRGRQGNVPTSDVLREAGVEGPSPALPDWIQRWREADLATSRET